jgi:hypothetical protein
MQAFGQQALGEPACALERRPSRVGAKDNISHPPGAHDDLAAATAGLMVRMIGIRDYSPKSFSTPFVDERPSDYTTLGLPEIVMDPGSTLALFRMAQNIRAMLAISGTFKFGGNNDRNLHQDRPKTRARRGWRAMDFVQAQA